MKIALLTCKDLSDYIVDDELLFSELQKNHDVSWCVWNEPQSWNDFDVAIIRTTWDYTEYYPEFENVLSQIEESSCRLYNSLERVRWNANKSYLLELQEKGMAVVPTADFNKDSFLSLYEQWQTDRLVCKPYFGASASGIQIVKRGEATPKRSMPSFVQPFLPEILNGELSFHFFKGEYSHAVKKVPKDGDFRVQEEHGGDIQAYEASASEIEHAKSYLQPGDLYSRVDLVQYQNKWVLMELELIEPSLYLRYHPSAVNNFCSVINQL